MPRSGNLKITPRDIADFIKTYNLEKLGLIEQLEEYRKYLTANVAIHHYGLKETKEEWFMHAVVEHCQSK